ncbi:HAD family hydrolase [Brevirhabdus pacifica]|uniref:HAD family hydrolase n=1 Tax=Brevirhabdus pacifica TaxID=1267768 RepID=A0A1U7DH63_9RHOB|nr:TIGR01459 family HAD-type hydrolase [Brevirhabdus pacifica]APX89239.1 HAD family hydrolase [Brevirhabdus pacifica]OWU76716.1 HAD family hydrolase [Loktanella sp. 22II-4b]PJJ86154.1 HAD superfamily hydrolase (TIGR01459 family) [Brevirhabdus pacifica]
MTQIVESLSEIAAQYDALFVDLWGCVHDGQKPFAEAVEALRAYRAGGGKVVLVTNSPRPRKAVEAQLAQIGVDPEAWDSIATSGDSARTAMFQGAVGTRVHHVGTPEELSFFEPIRVVDDPVHIELVPLDQAEGLVVTGVVNDLEDRPEDYRGTLLYAKQKGMKLLCANPDLIVDRGPHRVYCAGAIAQLYTEMGGTSLYFGKPHPPIYDLARRRLAKLGADVPDGRILAIGDGIRTDVAGAAGEDLDCLFISGGLAAEETGTERQPDPGKLTAYLREVQMDPSYTIGFLR